jgi:large subunit ribosomal protein L17
MRHRRQGRTLGRSPSHRKAMFRNMASNLFLTERDAEFEDNAPKVKGRIITTLPKAKESRPLIERCITIAKKSLVHKAAADEIDPSPVNDPVAFKRHRRSQEWKDWRKTEKGKEWAVKITPYITAKRRVFALLRNKQAVDVLFSTIAGRYVDRPGGYTRILKLAKPRLGDAGARAILELVGVPERDRAHKKAEKPAFNS